MSELKLPTYQHALIPPPTHSGTDDVRLHHQGALQGTKPKEFIHAPRKTLARSLHYLKQDQRRSNVTTPNGG
jgi:hypothetical protein